MSTGWGGNFVNRNPHAKSNNNNNYRSPSNNKQNILNTKKNKLNLIHWICILIVILGIVYGVLYILHIKQKINLNLPIFPKSKDESKN